MILVSYRYLIVKHILIATTFNFKSRHNYCAHFLNVICQDNPFVAVFFLNIPSLIKILGSIQKSFNLSVFPVCPVYAVYVPFSYIASWL